MKYSSAAFAARARLANDDAYRVLAEKAAASQAENQASLTAIQAELATVSASLAAVEKVLKQVG
jgi:phage shock protein A